MFIATKGYENFCDVGVLITGTEICHQASLTMPGPLIWPG